jgi:N-acyl-D-amino-acid deacylase
MPAGSPATGQDRFDVLNRGGRVMDGSGNPWIRADAGIRGGWIAAVGRLPSASAVIDIDAQDRLVGPGFIDVHSHAGETLARPQLRHLVRAAMREGALGRSSGLFYAPASFATTDELVPLATVVSETGGV